MAPQSDVLAALHSARGGGDSAGRRGGGCSGRRDRSLYRRSLRCRGAQRAGRCNRGRHSLFDFFHSGCDRSQRVQAGGAAAWCEAGHRQPPQGLQMAQGLRRPHRGLCLRLSAARSGPELSRSRLAASLCFSPSSCCLCSTSTTRGLDQSLTAIELDPWVHWQYTPGQWQQWSDVQADRLRATPPAFVLARDWRRFLFPFAVIIGGVAVFCPGSWLFKGVVPGACLRSHPRCSRSAAGAAAQPKRTSSTPACSPLRS
jgi:hypothetical protein